MMAIHSLTLRCVTFNIGVADEKQWGHDKYAKAFKPGWKDFVETHVKDLHTKPKNPHLGCESIKKRIQDTLNYNCIHRIQRVSAMLTAFQL